VICFDGGVFVGATPDIVYLKDTNGDGVADVRRVVFTGFGQGVERLNVQQLLNSFQWGPTIAFMAHSVEIPPGCHHRNTLKGRRLNCAGVIFPSTPEHWRSGPRAAAASTG